jgi:hypothetical protein
MRKAVTNLCCTKALLATLVLMPAKPKVDWSEPLAGCTIELLFFVFTEI